MLLTLLPGGLHSTFFPKTLKSISILIPPKWNVLLSIELDEDLPELTINKSLWRITHKVIILYLFHNRLSFSTRETYSGVNYFSIFSKNYFCSLVRIRTLVQLLKFLSFRRSAVSYITRLFLIMQWPLDDQTIFEIKKCYSLKLNKDGYDCFS